MKEKNDSIIENLQKSDKKSIFTITSVIYLAIILIYEFLYCNYEFVNSITTKFNFSIYRIIVYISIFFLFYKFKDRFIEQAIEGFKSKIKCYGVFICLFFPIMGAIMIITEIVLLGIIYFSTAILLYASLLLLLLSVYISNDIIHNAIVISLLIGIVFSITITINNQLDEKRHFLAAYSISIGRFNLKEAGAEETVAEMPRMLNQKCIIKCFNIYPTKNIITNFEGKEVEDTPCDYFALSYIPSALGIFIARTLGGSIADIYITGRIFCLIGYTIAIYYALKMFRTKKNIIFAIFFLPMLLALASVYSPDGIGVAISALFIAYCLKLREEEHIDIKKILKLVLIFALLLTVKSIGYIGLALIIFILPIKKILKENKKYILVFLIALIIVLLLFSTAFVNVIHGEADSRSLGSGNNKQFNYILNNPLEYAKVLIRHLKYILTDLKSLHFINAPMFFRQTYNYIGDILLVYLIFLGITDNSEQYKLRTRFVFILTFIIFLSIISTLMYLSYTKLGSNIIVGYQQRYMFPVLFLLLSSISIKKLGLKNLQKNAMALSYVSIMLLVVSTLDVITLLK